MKTYLAAGFLLLSSICILITLYGVHRASKKAGMGNKPLLYTSLGILAWLTFITIASLSGFLMHFGLPPRMIMVLMIPLILMLWLSLSGRLDTLLTAIPPHQILYFQSFRIAVEVLLLGMVTAQLLPVQMSWEGMNYDVLSGVLGLVAGFVVSRSKEVPLGIMLGYNIIGMLLLLTIVTIAILSMPTAIRYFQNEPSNTIVATFPFVYLPGVLVVLAYSLHILSFRQIGLLRRQRRTA